MSYKMLSLVVVAVTGTEHLITLAPISSFFAQMVVGGVLLSFLILVLIIDVFITLLPKSIVALLSSNLDFPFVA